jgi:hypothetical protein
MAGQKQSGRTDMTRISAALFAATLLLPAAADAGGGSFAGASGHRASGGVTVVQAGGHWEVRLGADFSFDGAPDPRVGFGKAGTFVPGTDFEKLRVKSGAQTYIVPEGIDPAAYDEVYIWCRRYSMPLAVAELGD